jgi:hypothetical protein
VGLSMNVRQIFVFFDVFLSRRNPGKGLEMVNRCVCPTYFRSIARALVPDARNMMLVMQVLVTSVLVMQVFVMQMLVIQVLVTWMLVMQVLVTWVLVTWMLVMQMLVTWMFVM